MPHIIGIDHVQLAIPEGGEPQARQFYSGMLGLAEIAKPDALAGRGGAWFDCGSFQLHMGVEADFRPSKKAHPALVVDDVDAFEAHLQAAGQEIFHERQIPGCKRIFVKDPFGNRIELLQRVPDLSHG